MSKTPDETPAPVRLHPRARYPQLFDWVSMAVYVLLVFSWALGVYPMGRDYAAQDLPAALAPVWQALQHAFGSTFWPYHAVNIVLLYGCMIAIFYLMKLGHRGPWWLGTLAAVLFMANPVHTESVANLCGMVDLLPCFLALVALDAYCLTVRAGSLAWLLLAAPLFALAAITAPENIGLVLVCALFETVLASDGVSRRAARLGPILLVGLGAAVLHRDTLFAHGGDVAAMFGPLYFIVYPIGFLPGTAQTLHEHPWLGWLAAAAVLAMVFLIYRKARRPMLLFALLAMPAVRVFGGGHAVDPVHLIGGGQLLLANALFTVGLTALFHRIMDHPKWRRLTIAGTSLLCLVFMLMQVHAVMQWRVAGAMLRDFHAQLRLANGTDTAPASGEALLVSPDIQYIEGAPLCLSASLVFDDRNLPYRPELPAFSGGIHAAPPINVFTRKGVRMQSRVQENNVSVLVEGAKPVDVLPLKPVPEISVQVQSETSFRLDAPFPATAPHLLVLPGRFPWPSSTP